jgi:glycosyltransferase involved in cell wall biosynthesis
MAAAGPFFSIIMATHLRPALLRRALQSLREQSFRDFETIVVADAWDPESAAVAAELLGAEDSFIKRRGEPGPASSRNLGLRLARGEWMLFLDDDDRFLPQHLQAVHAQAQRPDAQVLFTNCEVVIEDRGKPGMPAASTERFDLLTQDVQGLWVKNFIPNNALAYRRSVLDDCRFDTHLASLEDWDFLLGVCTRSLPQPCPGGGVAVHKDRVPGNSRNSREEALGSTLVLDVLHIYRRWPAPTEDLQTERQDYLGELGMRVPLEWL